jgi:hypothetical protein
MAITTKVRRVISVDRSVRDHPQKVIVMPDIVVVQSFVGRIKASEYNIKRADWAALEQAPWANLQYSKTRFILEHTRSYDDEPGGPCQADRIRDSQRMAIDEGLKSWRNLRV